MPQKNLQDGNPLEALVNEEHFSILLMNVQSATERLMGLQHMYLAEDQAKEAIKRFNVGCWAGPLPTGGC